MAYKLIERLDRLLIKRVLNEPFGDDEKRDAIEAIEAYIIALDGQYDHVTSWFRIVTGSSDDSYDEAVAIKEFTEDAKKQTLLARLCLEKVVSAECENGEKAAFDYFVEHGYCVVIVSEAGGKQYYALSKKGEKAVKSKAVKAAMKKAAATSEIPSSLIRAFHRWTNLYARRVELLTEFYNNNRDGAKHIIFSPNGHDDMVFGCEINDEIGVSYVFAGIFDDAKDGELAELKSMAESGLIDKIIVAVNTKEDKNMLLAEGLDLGNASVISFEVLRYRGEDNEKQQSD